jgi:uncharacterized protein
MREEGLAIFAKIPSPGHVKTRLLTHLSPKDAAALYKAFILDTLTQVKPLDTLTRYLACYPSSAEPFFQSLAEEYHVGLLDQSGNDLGERMGGVVRALLEQRHERIVLMGTDSPTLPAEYVKQAFDALEKQPVVIGPSHDGGYYLLGLSAWIPEVFKAISWGTEKVLEQTVRKLRGLNLEYHLLPQWYDVDDYKGLKILLSQLSGPPATALHTTKILKSLRLINN